MANFDKAFNKVIKAEGGYVRDRDDAGGETYLGVARRFHKNSYMWHYVDSVTSRMQGATQAKITKELKKIHELDNLVKDIYKTEYWNKLKCGQINSQKLAEQLFDMGVNSGIKNAVKLMQNVIGADEKTGYVTNGFINKINEVVRLRIYNKI